MIIIISMMIMIIIINTRTQTYEIQQQMRHKIIYNLKGESKNNRRSKMKAEANKSDNTK